VRHMGRLAAILVLAASGCAWTPRPYAADPLVRGRAAVRGDPAAVRPPPVAEPPTPPDPPGVTSPE
jgi:hypothetical protein